MACIGWLQHFDDRLSHHLVIGRTPTHRRRIRSHGSGAFTRDTSTGGSPGASANATLPQFIELLRLARTEDAETHRRSGKTYEAAEAATCDEGAHIVLALVERMQQFGLRALKTWRVFSSGSSFLAEVAVDECLVSAFRLRDPENSSY